VKVWQQSKRQLLDLPVEELQAIVGADELNVKNEEMIWECVVRWIAHDTDNRKGHIVDLLQNIRLGLLDRNFLHEKVSIPLKNVGSEGSPSVPIGFYVPSHVILAKKLHLLASPFVYLPAYNKSRILKGSFHKNLYSIVLVKSDGSNFGENFRITGKLQVDPHEVFHAKFIGWGIPRLLWFPVLP
jgi:hypothetical protein